MHWSTTSLFLLSLPFTCLSGPLRTDDSDPSVTYLGAWTLGEGIQDDPAQNWDRTLHYSNIPGANATFKFTGTSISVYGSFHPPGTYSMQSQYSVDGQEPFNFLPNQKVSQSLHQALFYSSQPLPHGEHTLVVVNLGEQLFLDFFDVQDESPTTPPSTTAASVTTGSKTPTKTPTSSFQDGQTVTVTSIATATQGEESSLSAGFTFQTTSNSQDTLVTSPGRTDTSNTLSPALLSKFSSQPTAGTTIPSNSTTISSSTVNPLGAAQLSPGGHSRILSKGAIAGIAVGSAIIVAVLSAGLWWYRRSREGTWLATDLHFEPSKMTVPDPSFRGHRPTLPGFIYGERRASEQRRSARSSSVHLVGYSSSTPSTCSD